MAHHIPLMNTGNKKRLGEKKRETNPGRKKSKRKKPTNETSELKKSVRANISEGE